jgi:hypothetical protein
MKYLRFAKCKECPQHIKVRDAAVELLTTIGSFSKEVVCESTGLSSFIDSIRWDYLVRMIEEEYSTELLPMSIELFRKKRNTDAEIHFPERYIAGGHGKRTAGYAIASVENGHFLVHLLKRKRSIAEGCVKAATATDDLRVKLGVPAEITSIEHVRHDAKMLPVSP